MTDEREKYLRLIEEDNNDIETLRSACTKVLFNCVRLSSRNEAILNTFINSTHEDSLFINNNFHYAKDLADNIYILLNSTNYNKVKEAFYKLYKDTSFTRYVVTVYHIYREKLKHDYANKFGRYYTHCDNFIDKHGNIYTNVIDITDKDFFLNIHNINMGYANIGNAYKVVENPNKFTQENFGNSNTISGAILSPDFIGHAIYSPDNDVQYGFNHLTKDDFLYFGNEDLYTEWNCKEGTPTLRYPCTQFNPDTLLHHIKWKYGESVIWRSTQGHKRKPDYILCVDQINENSLRHAEHYNIPIYYINSIKLLKNQFSKLLQQFERLKELNTVDLLKYENFLDKIRAFAFQLHSLEIIIDFSVKDIQNLIFKADKFYQVAKTHIQKVISDYECKEDNEVDIIRQRLILERNINTYPEEMFKAFMKKCEHPTVGYHYTLSM